MANTLRTSRISLALAKRASVWTIAFVSASLLTVSAFAASEVIKQSAAHAVSSAANFFAPRDITGRTNILLLGVGDREHAAADLTDSIVLASIDPKTSSVALLSLPRDVYMTDLTEVSPGRINTLYSSYKRLYRKDKTMTATGASVKAMESTAAEIGSRLRVPIHGVLKMDFTGFVNVIDALGGVDVDVKQKITDYTYPLSEGVVGIFELEAGPQHLDGETALKYARSRHSSSDFDRSARQQQMLAALLQKVRGQGLGGTLSLARTILASIDGHFEGTFSEAELFGIAGSLLPVRSDGVITMHLSTQTGGDYSKAAKGGFIRAADPGTSSGDILVPVSLTGDQADWGQIRMLASFLLSRRQVYLGHPLISVVSTKKTALEAHRLRNELTRYGFTVEEKTEPGIAGSGSSVMSGAGRDSAQFFSGLLGLPLLPHTGGDIRIVIDEDYRYVPFETRREHLFFID